MNAKVVSLEELHSISVALRAAQKKLVVTNGCFDLLHVGHVHYLQTARALGDALAVGINGDASVRALKGNNRPINSEQDRAEVIAALACVDYVTIFPEMRATDFLKKAAPLIYVKGGDYDVETLDPEERGALQGIAAEIRIVPFEKGYSTSGLIDRFRKTISP